MKKKLAIGLTAVAVLIFIIVGVATCSGSEQTGTAMSFKEVHSQGAVHMLVLTSPSRQEINATDLANRLKKDWQNKLQYDNAVMVQVFDSEDAALQWAYLEFDPQALLLSDEEWDKINDPLWPHLIADYSRNKTSGLNEVNIWSEGNLVQKIKF